MTMFLEALLARMPDDELLALVAYILETDDDA